MKRSRMRSLRKTTSKRNTLEETVEQVVVEVTPEALTGNSFSLEDQEYQVLLKIVEARGWM